MYDCKGWGCTNSILCTLPAPLSHTRCGKHSPCPHRQYPPPEYLQGSGKMFRWSESRLGLTINIWLNRKPLRSYKRRILDEWKRLDEEWEGYKVSPAKSRKTLKSVSEGMTPDWNKSCPITCVHSFNIIATMIILIMIISIMAINIMIINIMIIVMTTKGRQITEPKGKGVESL